MKNIGTKNIVILLTSFIIFSTMNAQTTLVFQPDSSQGKDAYIDSRVNNNNYGNHIDFSAISWTNKGRLVDVRGLIDFDLSSIPEGVRIISAKLSLYSYDSPANGSHSTRRGSNESVLNRITTAWDENKVTWNNQPAATTENQVFLPSSTSSIQDYLNIDVTNLVQDMIDDPNNSYGFLFKLKTEHYYSSMIFASSDHASSRLHPKLEITFTETIEPDDCLTFQPAATSGKDAYIDSRLSKNNYGKHIDFPAISWTNGGRLVDGRGLIDFDLSSIPEGVTIHFAKLSLYSYDSPANGSHSTRRGSNESVLNRITTAWDENKVTWNNQPARTTENQVFLSESISPIQDFLNIDVTNLVQDMIDDPNNSYGFLLKLKTEQYYRRMIFASSDHPNAALHPKLEVCYYKGVSTVGEGR